MRPENRTPETNKFSILAIRPESHRRLKMFCARTGFTIVDTASQAIDEFLQRMDKDASHAS